MNSALRVLVIGSCLAALTGCRMRQTVGTDMLASASDGGTTLPDATAATDASVVPTMDASTTTADTGVEIDASVEMDADVVVQTDAGVPSDAAGAPSTIVGPAMPVTSSTAVELPLSPCAHGGTDVKAYLLDSYVSDAGTAYDWSNDLASEIWRTPSGAYVIENPAYIIVNTPRPDTEATFGALPATYAFDGHTTATLDHPAPYWTDPSCNAGLCETGEDWGVWTSPSGMMIMYGDNDAVESPYERFMFTPDEHTGLGLIAPDAAQDPALDLYFDPDFSSYPLPIAQLILGPDRTLHIIDVTNADQTTPHDFVFAITQAAPADTTEYEGELVHPAWKLVYQRTLDFPAVNVRGGRYSSAELAIGLAGSYVTHDGVLHAVGYIPTTEGVDAGTDTASYIVDSALLSDGWHRETYDGLTLNANQAFTISDSAAGERFEVSTCTADSDGYLSACVPSFIVTHATDGSWTQSVVPSDVAMAVANAATTHDAFHLSSAGTYESIGTLQRTVTVPTGSTFTTSLLSSHIEENGSFFAAVSAGTVIDFTAMLPSFTENYLIALTCPAGGDCVCN